MHPAGIVRYPFGIEIIVDVETIDFIGAASVQNINNLNK